MAGKNILLIDCYQTTEFGKSLLESPHGYDVDWVDSIPAAVLELEKKKGRKAVVIEPIMSIPSEDWLKTEGKKLSEKYLGFSEVLFSRENYRVCGLYLAPIIRELEPSAKIIAYSLWGNLEMKITQVGKRTRDLLSHLKIPHVSKPNIDELVKQIES